VVLKVIGANEHTRASGGNTELGRNGYRQESFEESQSVKVGCRSNDSLWVRILRSFGIPGSPSSLRNCKGEVTLETFPVTNIGFWTSGLAWYSLSLLPQSGTRTKVRCDIYRPLGRADIPTDETTTQLKWHVQERIRKLEGLQAQLVANDERYYIYACIVCISSRPAAIAVQRAFPVRRYSSHMVKNFFSWISLIQTFPHGQG
jgi:hypothetical protein